MTDEQSTTTTEHPSQMSLQEARQRLASLDGIRDGQLLKADEDRKAVREATHKWYRKYRKSLELYIAVLETEQPPQ